MQDDNRQKLSAVGKTSARSMNWLADIGLSLIYWCWLIRCPICANTETFFDAQDD